MTEELREQAIRAIVSQDPRRAGERALVLAMQHCEAEAGALFSLNDDELSLFVGRSIDQLTLDRASEIWRTHGNTLRLGTEQRIIDVPVVHCTYLVRSDEIRLRLAMTAPTCPLS